MADSTIIVWLGLWLIVAVQAAIIHNVLRETKQFQVLYRNLLRDPVFARLPTGTAAPHLEKIYGSGIDRTPSDDMSGTLIFVALQHEESRLYDDLHTAVHALWHRSHGRLFLICDGDADGCQRLAARSTRGMLRHPVNLIVDADGTLFNEYMIVNTPCAITIDGSGNIQRHGVPLSPEDAALRFGIGRDHRPLDHSRSVSGVS